MIHLNIINLSTWILEIAKMGNLLLLYQPPPHIQLLGEGGECVHLVVKVLKVLGGIVVALEVGVEVGDLDPGLDEVEGREIEAIPHHLLTIIQKKTTRMKTQQEEAQ